MTKRSELVLVLGATGQQGGATASALLEEGFRVRALVRDPSSARARDLAAFGVEVVPGDLRDRASIGAAVHGAYGVFSVQPSSGQPEYGVTDDDELRFGKSVADAAKAARVAHLVYTSVSGAAPGLGLGHFESKWQIEQHVHSLDISATILRPAPFMEILLSPHFGLANGAFVFFSKPDFPVQFIATHDIGKIAAIAFVSPREYAGKTIDLAGDELSGNQVAAKIGAAIAKPITYSPLPAPLLAQSDLLRRIVELVEQGKLTGSADIGAIRRIHPGVLTFDAWLAKAGAAAIKRLVA